MITGIEADAISQSHSHSTILTIFTYEPISQDHYAIRMKASLPNKLLLMLETETLTAEL